MTHDVLCGFHAVNGSLSRHPDKIDRILIDRERRDRRTQELLDTAASHDVLVEHCSRDAIDRAAAGAKHQGVVAYQRRGAALEFKAVVAGLPQRALVLVLDGIEDPRNLGACLRSAEGAGVDAVILPRDRSSAVTATVRRVAAGAAESLNIATVPNIGRAIVALQQAGLWVVGAALDAPQPYYAADLKDSVAVVLGAEARGLRALTREKCDFLVSIPMAGAVESLNVSVATGILLFEAARQRGID
ncbi:MAG: 23S rRNA (guanosine(2251)-2'-O)-methyltransferase RlmB [Gammaproteobacteria bacterium]|nr:23S rRNA (guanosine(2251)-2'-O)-methyltransferase RlmB [Gammaproteobacteria bacterium]